jgi:hypothetical protein
MSVPYMCQYGTHINVELFLYRVSMVISWNQDHVENRNTSVSYMYHQLFIYTHSQKIFFPNSYPNHRKINQKESFRTSQKFIDKFHRSYIAVIYVSSQIYTKNQKVHRRNFYGGFDMRCIEDSWKIVT